MGHRKRPLKDDWYHCTIRSAEKVDKHVRIVWTVDRGDFAYRNIIEKYSLTDEGIELLKDRMLELGYIIYEDYTDEFFFKQFVTTQFRAELHIGRMAERQVIKNVILERRVPTKPEDYNVKKEKSDAFYNKHNKGKTLPIQEET